MTANKKPGQWNKETIIIVGLMCMVFLWTLNRVELENKPQDDTTEQIEKSKKEATQVDKALVPLATGKEPIDKIFVQSGCAACHMIPGIRVAKGREGPKLELGTNASRRLADPNYRGQANTEWEYVQESILNPGAYIVQGYPDHVMPRWYGQKLTAGALDKIITYLLKIEEVP
ncbi:MAG: c-type cytochrome [Nitrospira sp.]|nr:c-type cytochrome [Nitrospira sp.]